MPAPIKTNPYGISDFANLRKRDAYFVDRTSRIPGLETLPYQLFLRPRRFGKSLLVSMLSYYYDVLSAPRFDELFSGTWIHAHPTPYKNQFLVMRFDFSKVDGATLEQYQQSFESTCMIALKAFIRKYRTVLDGEVLKMVAATKTFGVAFDTLTSNADVLPNKIYILIDEYDSFSNRVLAQKGEQTYRDLCHGEGFFKRFFTMLKAQSDVVTNIFITGVSPMTLDDVTSGFNIAQNISQLPQFATLCGFTHADIREVFQYYDDDGQFPIDQEEAFRLVTDWYDNYRFSPDHDAQVVNPALFLGFLGNSIAIGHLPRRMDDRNVRMDYYKLRHLVTTDGRLNGKFAALERLVADGSFLTELVDSFQAETLTRPANFLSLFFYYGMLTIGSEGPEGLRLVIPNQAMRSCIAQFVLSGYQDVYKVNPRTQELANLLGEMAKTGDWRPAIALAAEEVRALLSPRDLLDGEKAVQTALATLCTTSRSLLVRTEHLANFGFAALTMQPDLASFPFLRYGALIEVKYIKKGEKVSETAKKHLLADAKAQADQYVADHRLAQEWRLRPKGSVTLIRLCVIFHGEELLLAEEI